MTKSFAYKKTLWNGIKRSPLKRKSTWKKIHPISKRPHRIARRKIPQQSLDIIHERSGGQCEFVWDSVRCTRRATDPDHTLARSAGGSHDPSNLKHVCRICHRWKHDNPEEAIQRGFTIPYAGYVML